MKKRTIRTFASCLLVGAAAAVSLAGWTLRADAESGVAADVPFYDYPMSPGASSVSKNADGNFVVSQSSGGGGARLFYGDYVSGGAENVYFLDLTDTSITLSVDRLQAGKGIDLAFMTYRENGNAYPMQPYGQGFEIKLTDDNGGNTGFLPSLTTFSYDGQYTQSRITGNEYLVYNNVQPRDSYLGKEMTIHLFSDESNLNVHIDWVRDGNNTDPYNFRAQLPLSALPTTGDYAFDYTKAYFMIGNDADDGAALTITDISDPVSDAYYENYGGKYRNAARYTEEYRLAATALAGETVSGKEVKDYYYTQMNFEGLDPAGMRKSDRYQYDTAKAISTEGFDEKALALKAEVFAGYTVDSEIADEKDAIGAFAFYTRFSDSLTEYAAVAEHIRASLSEKDFGQKTVEAAVETLLRKYTAAARADYPAALKDYEAVLAQYNKLSAFARGMVGNYADLQAWKEGTLAEMKTLYYSAEGSYFTNEYDWVEGESGSYASKSFAGAQRFDDGSTKLLLSADATNRLIYGTDIAEGKWTDYAVDLADFEMKFTVDSSAANARFAINFVTRRSALPYGDEKNAGLSLFFRMGFEGAAIGLALTETAGGLYPNQNPSTPQLEGFINDWGGFGALKCDGDIYGKTLTVSLKAEEAGIRLTVSAEGGNSASILLTNEYVAALFKTETGTHDTSKLALTFSVGEGMDVSFSKGKDIELTVKEISDDYAATVGELFADFDAYKTSVKTLSAKDALTFEEIRGINTKANNIAAAEKMLRRYEAESFAVKKGTLESAALDKIDNMAAAYFKAQIAAISAVTPDNYGERTTALAQAEEQWKTATDSQKALYPEYAAKIAEIKADIAGCEAAKGVIDDIAVLIAKSPLPATVDALRAEYTALETRYNALAEKYKNQVSNGAEFVAYGETLDAYDPAQAVENAIEKLFTDYAVLTSANKNAAKTALEAVRAAYAELTDGQKADVKNAAKTDEFAARIAAFEQSQIDYALAAAFDKEAAEETAKYATITAENRTAALAAATSLKAKYEALTETQKAFAEKYALIGELEEKIAAFDAEQEAKEAADAVVALIGAIGTVENTQACKGKIDAARAAYDALSAAAKEKVSNLSVLEKAETDYAALQKGGDSQSSSAGCKSGCKGAVGAQGIFFASTLLLAAAVIVLIKKSGSR